MIQTLFAKVHQINLWTFGISQGAFLDIFSNRYTTQNIFQNFHDFQLLGEPNTSSLRVYPMTGFVCNYNTSKIFNFSFKIAEINMYTQLENQ